MPSLPKRNVTIKDVAWAAEVSMSTVSHAFSGARPISQATRKRIFDASKALGYVPNAHARKLRLGKSGMLGLALRPTFDFIRTPDDAETFNRLAGSMAIACLHRGLGLVHVPDIVGNGHDIVPMDGCIIAHPNQNDPAIDFLDSAGIPYVLIDPDLARDDIPWIVSIDYAGGVRRILDAVSYHGRRHVVLIRQRAKNAWNITSTTAYGQWCNEMQHPPVVHEIDERIRGAALEAELEAIFATETGDLGIVYLASDTTESVLSMIARRGWTVPDDVSVAALTDTAHSRMSKPSMTAMDLAHEDASEAAIAMLIDRIAGVGPPIAPVVIEPRVSVRESTAVF
ncbi:LacI family DNA-binding transcriptional regulator [Spelaeicoccus albus]|uniref:DNA-binding LacI/PurR family transcriptional regulator n=1 Tax=Spelaeicoccus albus TaxID=1280376 RepID=A0A7Z0ABX2_9MICO|nr:LacI family DNA-binding transcriptional regulator [Spelaeicoccus albus]NYI67025.1 DNA-binding LacI/PurR family transcriptional regulator [Spelaeicoccus albus]